MNRDVIVSFNTKDLQDVVIYVQTLLKYTMLEVLLLMNNQIVRRGA